MASDLELWLGFLEQWGELSGERRKRTLGWLLEIWEQCLILSSLQPEREKDGSLEGAEFEERKPSKAVEEFVADVLPFYKPQPDGQGALAAAAQERSA